MSSEIFKLISALEPYPRANLGLTVTEIEHLPRLSSSYGVDLLVKRDDTTSLAMGGNKVRQLEYYLGPATAADTDTVLITGAVQSNFVRLCAAAAARLGWHAIVQLEKRVPKDDAIYNHSGNVLLNHLLGAEVRYFGEGENEVAADAQLDQLADELKAQGRSPHVIHLGLEHPPIGGLGYAFCAGECFRQLQSMQRMPDHIVVPSGSGLTHAGFLVGARSAGWNVPIHGICVRRTAEQQRSRIIRRATELNTMLGESASLSDADIKVDDTVLAPGYGQLNDRTLAAMSMAAKLEGLLLDPVYSGRTLAGLSSLIEQGVIQAGQRVLFVHTGGTPALFAYQHELMQAVNNADDS